MNTFIGFELPEKIRELLHASLGSFDYARASIDVIDAEKIYVVCRYVGSVEEEKLPALLDQLRGVCSQILPFEIHCENLAVFPLTGPVRSIAYLVSEKSGMLTSFSRELDSISAVVRTMARSDEFQVHIPLARVEKDRSKGGLKHSLKNISLLSPKIAISECAVVCSRKVKKELDYEVVARIPFTAKIAS